MNEARYSGPGKSGICVCGCRWQDHHLGVVMNVKYAEETGECYIPEECCKYGFNEAGGKKYNPETDMYEDHCHCYEDVGPISGGGIDG
jgi:hypothetical protein